MAATSPSDSRYSGGYRTPVSPNPQSVVARQPPAFLQGFIPSKAAKADGEAPKRRGPKPDSKPAATKRQEMNRLAQRTHRERKDQYAHELELRVQQARDTYFEMVREQEQLKHENQEMAQLLRAHGIPYQSSYIRKPSISQQSSFHSTSPADSFSGTSMSRTQTADGSPFQSSISAPSPNGLMRRSPHSPGTTVGFPTPSPGNTSGGLPAQSPTTSFEHPSQAPIGVAITTDHKASTGSIPHIQQPPTYKDAIFINSDISAKFIVQLEQVCHEHKKMMCDRGTNPNLNELSGHALMLTSPPEDHYRYNPEGLTNDHYHQVPDISNEALIRMLQTSSSQLDFGLEMAPITALQTIVAHERASDLNLSDFEELRDRLQKYMNCYGFGAVMPGYALREELENIFAQKDRQRHQALGLNGFNFNTPPTPSY
ncbi:MAG: hypothetical protein Q9219_004871 [cf. Caloplaca sp. 3 TL-2023]